MFCEDPRALPRPPCICLVAPSSADEAGPDESLGQSALSLAANGWKVHVLVCDRETRPGRLAELAKMDVAVSQLTQMDFPPSFSLPGCLDFPRLAESDRVRWALAELHKSHTFDLIQFADRGGLGFRAIQAKRLGLDFAGVSLIVKLHGPAQRLRQLRQEWPNRPEDLADDFCERYAFEHADGQVVQDADLVDAVRQLGWKVRADACVLTAPVGSQAADATYREFLVGQVSKPALVTRRQVCKPAPQMPLVTVSVAYYNLAPYLEEALASLAAQTYPALEVLVINDGSTDPEAVRVFRDMQTRYPRFHFFEQANAGIGATRNRGLELAGGEYFLPMDADNVARPDMISRLVTGLERNPDVAALSCYFLAFRDSADLAPERFLYSYRPIGGPHVLGCLSNIYGDGNALFRSQALRAIGGFTTDRETSFEDWEVFVKLVNAGYTIDVFPEVLFYYRHRAAGFSRVTSDYHNHQRVLRQYVEGDHWPRPERLALWNLLAGLQRRVDSLEEANRTLNVQLQSLRYQVMDRLQHLVNHVPFVPATMKWLVKRWTKNANAKQVRAE